MNQAFYRKWRPQTWEQVVGQEHVIQTLRNAVQAGRVAHAYLFAGPRGTGKTTTARLLAKAVNCLDEDLSVRPCDACAHCRSVDEGRFIDLIEIDAASNTSVDDVRDLRDKINFSPNQGRFKVYIIDEVHMLSTAAFNALLKTLEEPPPHAIFILATTEIHKIPATVLSRCQRHEFRRLPVAQIRHQLQIILEGEHLQAEDEALALIARQSTGSLRDAISLLDQLSSTGQEITLALVQSVLGTAASQAVLDTVTALDDREAAVGLGHLHRALDAGSDPRQFARQMVDYLRNVLLIKMGSGDQVENTQEIRAHMARHAASFEVADLLKIIRLFEQAAASRGNWQPSLPLELAFVDALAALKTPSVAETLPLQAAQSAPTRAVKSPPKIKNAPAGAAAPNMQSNQSGAGADTNRSQWRKIKALLKKRSPQTEGLLNSCRHQFKDDRLELGFASTVLKSKMEKEGNLEHLQAVLDQVFEQKITVHCVLSSGEQTEAELPEGADRKGMVKTALDLGGKVVDIQ